MVLTFEQARDKYTSGEAVIISCKGLSNFHRAFDSVSHATREICKSDVPTNHTLEDRLESYASVHMPIHSYIGLSFETDIIFQASLKGSFSTF